MDTKIFSHYFTVSLSDIDKNNKITNKGFLRLMEDTANIHCEQLRIWNK